MALLDSEVLYLRPSEVSISARARRFLLMEKHELISVPEQSKWSCSLTLVFDDIGNIQISTGYDRRDELSSELEQLLDDDAILVTIPVRVEIGEVLKIDYDGHHLFSPNTDFMALLRSFKNDGS